MSANKLKVRLLISLTLVTGCIEQYQAPKTISTSNYLVIDSSLDPVNKTCTVNLTRTQPLTDTKDPLNETGAEITLEDNDSRFITIQEIGNGKYLSANLATDNNHQYRINILTANGTKYQSAWVTPLFSPPIDSITWDEYYDQLRLKVSTHDPTTATKFYRWTFDETWEYQSAFASYFEYHHDSVVERHDDIHTCWKTEKSSQILCANTLQLKEDVITDFAINTIPKGSQKLSIRYSINVKQTALSEDAYNYLNLLKKNTQNLGTPFDPLPAQVTGNFTSLNSNTPVIGYFFSSSVQEQRIFVGFRQLPIGLQSSPDYGNCQLITVLNDNLANYSSALVPVIPYSKGGDDLGYFLSSPSCTDCRLAGGINHKPDFW